MLYPGRQTYPAGAELLTFRVRAGQTVEALGNQILSHLLQILVSHVLICGGLVRYSSGKPGQAIWGNFGEQK